MRAASFNSSVSPRRRPTLTRCSSSATSRNISEAMSMVVSASSGSPPPAVPTTPAPPPPATNGPSGASGPGSNLLVIICRPAPRCLSARARNEKAARGLSPRPLAHLSQHVECVSGTVRKVNPCRPQPPPRMIFHALKSINCTAQHPSALRATPLILRPSLVRKYPGGPGAAPPAFGAIPLSRPAPDCPRPRRAGARSRASGRRSPRVRPASRQRRARPTRPPRNTDIRFARGSARP